MSVRSLLSALLLSAAPVLAGDLSLQGLYAQPKNSDLFSDGIGAEVQWRSWYTETMAFALSAGGMMYGANDDEYIRTGSGGAAGAQASGEVSVIPLGASVIFRSPTPEGITTHLELGLRNLLVDSGIDLARVGVDAGGQAHADLATLEFNDAVTGLGRVEFSHPVGESTSLVGGVGYQIDLVKSDISYLGSRAGEAEWAGVYFSAGVHIAW